MKKSCSFCGKTNKPGRFGKPYTGTFYNHGKNTLCSSCYKGVTETPARPEPFTNIAWFEKDLSETVKPGERFTFEGVLKVHVILGQKRGLSLWRTKHAFTNDFATLEFNKTLNAYQGGTVKGSGIVKSVKGRVIRLKNVKIEKG